MPLDNNKSSRQLNPWEKSYPTGIFWDEEIPEMTLVELFDNAMKEYKDRSAIDFMDKTYTYGELGELVDRFAKGLQDQGIGPKSKVGLALPNMPFYPIAYYAALKTGATVVNFNPLYTPSEMEHLIKDSEVDMMLAMNLEQLYPRVKSLQGTGKFKKLVVCDMADVLPTKKAVGFRVLNALTDFTRNVPLIGKKVAELRNKNGVQPVARIKKDKNVLSFKDLLNSKGAFKPVEIHPNDTALLQYTGGTTGMPKAVVLTHNNIAANTQQTATWFTKGTDATLQGKQDAKALAILPFYHVFSMTVMLNLPLHLGGQIVMLPKFDAKEALKTITEKKPSLFAGVPSLYGALNKELAANGKQYDMSSLNVCISGAAPLPQTTAQEFKKLAGIELLEGYGLSESSAAALANPVYGEKKPGSIGLPMPRTELKLVPQTNDKPKLDSSLPGAEAPVSMEGEICLRGPQIMKGYWNRPEQTAETIDKDGWLHTGDVGRMDKDGYVSIIGRIKDMTIVNGLKVWPNKVETEILKHEAIDEVAVIGLPDDRTGEKVAAYIVLKPGKTITDEELDTFLRERLAAYEVPKYVERRQSLPKTAIGKPDKKTLKNEALAKIAAASAKAPANKNNGPKI